MAKRWAKGKQEDAQEQQVEKQTEVQGRDAEASVEDSQEKLEQDSELEALKGELKEQEAQYLRLSAEFDNYRRRSRREQEELHQRAVCQVSAAWLPLIDNLQRGVEALKQQGAQDEAISGMELILRQADEVLKKLEIEEIPTDQPFDPNLHEAIMHVEEEGMDPGQIVEVFQVGYQRQGQVLRHSVVKVAN